MYTTLTIFFTFFVMLQFWNLFNARVFGTTDSAFKGLSKSYGMELIVLAILAGQFPHRTIRWSCIPHGTARLANLASYYRRFVHGVMGWRTCSPCSTYYSQKEKKMKNKGIKTFLLIWVVYLSISTANVALRTFRN